jgi:hypothetical protein
MHIGVRAAGLIPLLLLVVLDVGGLPDLNGGIFRRLLYPAASARVWIDVTAVSRSCLMIGGNLSWRPLKASRRLIGLRSLGEEVWKRQ